MCRVMRTGAVALALVAVSVASAGPAYAAGAPGDVKSVVAGSNEFALDLYGKLSAQEGNLFFSPFSISTALAMTSAGARGNTEFEMAQALRLIVEEADRREAGAKRPMRREAVASAFGQLLGDLNAGGEKGSYQLSVANALWAQKDYKFLDDFTNLVTKNYDAAVNNMDFAGAAEEARHTINAWVEKQTRDKIKELLKPGVVNADTRLVLTNAIYFKGDWRLQFKKDQTRDEPFTLAAGAKADVPMMQQKDKFKYMEGDGFQALELPYAGGELAMVVLLPRKADGIGALEKALTLKNLSAWLTQLHQQEATVFLPKFKMTSEFKLNDALTALGMKDAFVPDKANFSGMDGTENLFISAVVHKAFVYVNEAGTEAAAATGVVIGVTSMPREPVVFRADHPFVFLIRDAKTGSILFLGRVMNPKA